jgi:Rab guanine nucleotide exchange factor SEC2
MASNGDGVVFDAASDGEHHIEDTAPVAEKPSTSTSEPTPTPTPPSADTQTSPHTVLVNGHDVAHESGHEHDPDSQDAQTQLISSLRSQITDLFSQVTQLNSKLVTSYDRVSDLEDELHMRSSNLRQSSLKISQLELERTQHLSALNTGLLVEREQVKEELNRLMEKATDEAARRGKAETARKEIEKDLDDLSASLFDQANTMVAEARFSQHQSEHKVEEAQMALHSAEEAVAEMQKAMQDMQKEKEYAEKSMREMEVRMGKGKWAQRHETGNIVPDVKLLSSHLPYEEFLMFVAHLRSLHLSSPQPPAMSTLLPLPFIARLVAEDSYVSILFSCLFYSDIYTIAQRPNPPPRRRTLPKLALSPLRPLRHPQFPTRHRTHVLHHHPQRMPPTYIIQHPRPQLFKQ